MLGYATTNPTYTLLNLMAVKQKEGEKRRIEQCYVAANLISVAIKNQATETSRKVFIRRRQLL